MALLLQLENGWRRTTTVKRLMTVQRIGCANNLTNSDWSRRVAGRGWDQFRSQKTGDWKEDKCTLILLVITPTYFYLRVHFDDLHSSSLSQVTAETLVEMIGEKGDGGFVDHGPFAEGQNAGALTTAATRG